MKKKPLEQTKKEFNNFFLEPMNYNDYAWDMILSMYHFGMTNVNINNGEEIDELEKSLLFKNKIKQYFIRKRFRKFFEITPKTSINQFMKITEQFGIVPEIIWHTKNKEN